MTLSALVGVFRRWLYLSDLAPLYATLGAVAANLMDGEPVWLMLVGPPSSGKSKILQVLTSLPYVHPAATLNEVAMIERHYGRFLTGEAEAQLRLLEGDQQQPAAAVGKSARHSKPSTHSARSTVRPKFPLTE